MHIGKSIRVAMAKQGLRGKDVAKMLGVHQSSVSLMLARPTASGAMLDQLAKSFGMKVSDFVKLGEDDE